MMLWWGSYWSWFGDDLIHWGSLWAMLQVLVQDSFQPLACDAGYGATMACCPCGMGGNSRQVPDSASPKWSQGHICHLSWPVALTLGPWGTPSLTSHSDPEYSRMQLTRVSHLVSSGLKPAGQPHGTPCCPWHPASPGSTSTPRPSSSQISWSP